MRVDRSRSQILFGFLPEQTVDLQGRIWKVSSWDTDGVSIDDGVIRDELLRSSHAWSAQSLDRGFADDLRRGYEIQVLKLGRGGVRVDIFPDLWTCRACRRVQEGSAGLCLCGRDDWQQLQFVAYHECGELQAPQIRRCRTHNDAAIVYPGTSSLDEIRIVCPTCDRTLQRGLVWAPCPCGNGTLKINVHRAASVYRPVTVTLVTPPTTAESRQILESGGPARALSWALGGMETRTVLETGNTIETFVRQQMANGLSEAVARRMAQIAAEEGELDEDTVKLPALSSEQQDRAERDALTLSFATLRSRRRIDDLAETPHEQLAALYAQAYPTALERAGLEAVELVDRFPVLTGQFGYTRGVESDATAPLLTPFRTRRGDGYVVYAQPVETEALLFRLDALRVAEWLRARGHAVSEVQTFAEARTEILRLAHLPQIGDECAGTLGHDVFTLVHSFAHRVVRASSVHAGIDLAGLSELLVPSQLGFFMYAAGRGDFVLGGLQAVFEYDLHDLLGDAVDGETRCALDPGCKRNGGACMACLHLGEPSCRAFNGFLSRDLLFGSDGFLR